MTRPIDALLVAPPLYAERLAGLVTEGLISDAVQPFEHPQGLLSIASYAARRRRSGRSFDVRVLPLDAHLLESDSCGTSNHQWRLLEGDIEERALRIVQEYVQRLRPSIVGISVLYYLAEPFALRLAEHLKANLHPCPLVILGGQEVSFYDTRSRMGADNALLTERPLIDAIVRKEGEQTFLEVLERVSSGGHLLDVDGVTSRDGETIVSSPDRARCGLDELPALDFGRILLPSELSIDRFLRATNMSLVFMRGCKHGTCAFCTSQNWFGSDNSLLYARPSSIVSALQRFRETLSRVLKAGVTEIQILDENLNSDRRVFSPLCELLKDLQQQTHFTVTAQTRADCVDQESLDLMRTAGVDTLFIGVESGSCEVLERMSKLLATPLARDDRIRAHVSQRCGADIARLFPPVIQQVVCAISMVKEAGMNCGTFWMIGHPGSTPARERETIALLEFLGSTGLLTANDPVEVGIFVPLNGTAAREMPEVQLLEQDKRVWGRMTGVPVHQLLASDAGGRSTREVVFSRDEIAAAFREFRDAATRIGLRLVDDYGSRYSRPD